MRRRGGYGAGGGLIGLAIMLGLALMVLPFYGAYKLVAGQEEPDKAVGAVLLVIGTIIYIAAACERTYMIIREGGILGEALLVPDGEDLADLHEIANQMKENYGYHIDMIKAVETKSFSNRRHVCYPDDVMVVLFGMGMRPEQIWVRDILEEDYPEEICALGGTKILHTIPDGIEEMTFVGAGRLINEP